MLPKVKTTIYPVTLPDSKQKVEMRQLLAREYRDLSKAYVMGDESTVHMTLKHIITDCVVSEDFDFSTLSFADVEFLFLKLYSFSVDNSIKVRLQCTLEHDGKPCNSVFGMEIPIEEILVTEMPETKIDLGADSGIQLKLPSFDTWHSSKDKTDAEILFMMTDCVWVGDDVYVPGEDFSIEELSDWVDSLPNSEAQKINDFIDNTPTLTFTKEITCPTCGNKQSVVLRGLDDFLA